jgi:hypothetical protein
MFNHSIRRTDIPDSNPSAAQSEPALPPIHAGTREGRQNAILHMQQTRGNAATRQIISKQQTGDAVAQQAQPDQIDAYPELILYAWKPSPNDAEYYGGPFTVGFSSSTGDYSDIAGMRIGEQVTMTRNDFPDIPNTATTGSGNIDENGEIIDNVVTGLHEVHSSMSRLKNNPPLLIAQHVVKYRDKGGTWHDMEDTVSTKFTVECRGEKTFAITSYMINDTTEVFEQEYIGKGSHAPPCANNKP